MHALASARARDHTRLSQWEMAAAEYAKAGLLTKPLGDDAFGYACLFLIREDREGYNRFCQGMISAMQMKVPLCVLCSGTQLRIAPEPGGSRSDRPVGEPGDRRRSNCLVLARPGAGAVSPPGNGTRLCKV